MKQNNNNEKILKSSLSTLLKRFSSTDVITTLDKEYSSSSGKVPISLVDDNKILKKARINEKKLETTMATISEKGIASPVLVTQKDNRYEVIYPRIVYIAALKLKFDTLPVTVLNLEEEETLVFLASQIRDSKGSNIVELSLLLNALQKKYKYRQVEIASMMGQSRSQITNIMRLIKMPEWVLRDISNDKLSFGHARVLAGMPEDKLKEVVSTIYENNLSVRQLETLFIADEHKDVYEALEKKIDKKYKCKTTVKSKRVILDFESENDIEKFLKKIK